MTDLGTILSTLLMVVSVLDKIANRVNYQVSLSLVNEFTAPIMFDTGIILLMVSSVR